MAAIVVVVAGIIYFENVYLFDTVMDVVVAIASERITPVWVNVAVHQVVSDYLLEGVSRLFLRINRQADRPSIIFVSEEDVIIVDNILRKKVVRAVKNFITWLDENERIVIYLGDVDLRDVTAIQQKKHFRTCKELEEIFTMRIYIV